MPGKKSFAEDLAALDEMRRRPPGESVEALRRALAHRNNYVVAQAANLVSDFRMAEMVPDLLESFDRFFTNPFKTDPQCWAKHALAQALAALEYQEAEVFLRGMRHIQMEPVWKGQSDTAGRLRGACALGLVQCRQLSNNDLLQCLVDLFADSDKTVRLEAVRSVEQVNSPAAGLLLRMRAVVSGEEPEVLGACYAGTLNIEGKSAIPWVARFMTAGGDAATEAAFAISATRCPEAFDSLHQRFLLDHDAGLGPVLLSAIALTRQQAAADFLLDMVDKESPHAEAAIDAILRSRPADETMSRLREIIAGHPQFAPALASHRENPA